MQGRYRDGILEEGAARQWMPAPPATGPGSAVSSPCSGSAAEPLPPYDFHAFYVIRVASPGSLVPFIVPCKGRLFLYAHHCWSLLV